MENRRAATIMVLGMIATLASVAPVNGSEPPQTRISSFADLSGLMDELTPARLAPSGRLIATLQDDGWGWGGETPPPEKKPDNGGKSDDGSKPAAGDDRKGGDWGSGEAAPPPGEIAPATGEKGGEMEESGRRNWARKTRIGLEIGGFIPMGAMKEAFTSGQFAGLYLGFALPSVAGEYTPTMEIRLIEGMTQSIDQKSGFDISTTLLGVRDDFLFHLMPGTRSFNVFFFIGAGVMFEMSSGKGIDPDTGDSVSVSKTYPFFVVDTGIGAWLNISGPVDLFFRFEFDIIPMSVNVSLFALGEAGLQLRF